MGTFVWQREDHLSNKISWTLNFISGINMVEEYVLINSVPSTITDDSFAHLCGQGLW